MGAIERVFRGRRGGQERPAAAIVAGLWRNGEQGVWYDPSDMSTMYQDAAGTTPVYMPGQGQVDPPVGLLLDKRLGLARGPERLVNGDFSAGAANWSVSGNDATHIATFSGGTLRFQSDTTSPVMLVQQLGAMVAGRWYEITVTVSAWVSGSLKSDNFVQPGLPLASGAGVYKVIGLAAGTTFAFLRASANVDLTIDSISIRELLGNHAYQTTTTSRPTLSARYNLITYSEQFDAAAWTKTECSITPNVVVGPNGGLADKLIPSTAALSHYITCLAGTATESRTAYVVVKADGCSKVTLWPGGSATFAHYDLAAGTVSKEANVISSSITSLGDGWCVLRATWAVLSLTHLRVYSSSGPQGSAPTAGDGVSGLLIERADIRATNDGVGLPEYQRVVDPNTYDTVGFPPYLKPDGVDDWLQTAAVDFSGTGKLFVAAALRKLSDASVSTFVELSSTYANAGTFAIFAPAIPNNGEISFGLNGNIGSTPPYIRVMALSTPVSVVASCSFDISAPDRSAEINPRINGIAPTATAWGNATVSAGSGGLGNYPLYFFRRGGASIPFSGRDYGTIIVGRVLSSIEQSAVGRYLRQKSRAY